MEDLAKVIRRDSELRFSCSDIAALAGYYPYSDVIDLFEKYLYQGLDLLQQYDCKRLHIIMITKEEEVQSVLRKLDSTHQQKFEEIEQVTKQSYDQNVAKALIKEAVNLLATKDIKDRLSTDEVQLLEKEMQSKISTRYGVHCEDDALDKYESITGYPVKERNDSYYIMEVPVWVVDLNNDNSANTVVRQKISDLTVRRVMTATDANIKESHQIKDIENNNSSGTRSATNTTETTDEIVAPANNAFAIMNDAMKRKSTSLGTSSKPKRARNEPQPAFTIIGKVDGVSEQLDQASEDPSLWKPTRVIVEAKNRVNSIKHPPPLYEQIQLVSYMIMTGSKYGDLVQSVSRRKVVNAKRCEEIIIIDEDPNESSVSHTVTNRIEEVEEEQFHISRVTLNDTLYNHQQHWETVIMPRVYVFRDMIVALRNDDGLRAQYLLGEDEEKRHIISQHCPYFDL